MSGRYLVTGATGFIGSRLAHRLVGCGEEVAVIVRQSSDLWRLSGIRERVRLMEADLEDGESVRKHLLDYRPAVIYHCAAYGAYAHMQGEVLAIARANVMGTLNLLTAAMDVGFRCFVNTGSSGEYGIHDRPLREDMLPVPLNPYGASKVSAAMFCGALARAQGLPVMTLRVFSPYGPFDDRRRLIPLVIEKLRRGEDIQLSQGTEARDYYYVEDLIDLYLRVPDRATPWRGEVVNAGSGRQTTVAEIVETLSRLCDGKSRLLWGALPSRNFDSSVWVADKTVVEAELGWSPKTALEDGLRTTIRWHAENPPRGER